jgi:hypothetical protein
LKLDDIVVCRGRRYRVSGFAHLCTRRAVRHRAGRSHEAFVTLPLDEVELPPGVSVVKIFAAASNLARVVR